MSHSSRSVTEEPAIPRQASARGKTAALTPKAAIMSRPWRRQTLRDDETTRTLAEDGTLRCLGVENSDRKCQNVVTDSRVAPDEGSNLTCGTGLCRDDRSLEAKEPRRGFDCALQSGQILALSPARVEWEPRRNLMGLSVENSRRKLHNATRNSTKFLHSPWRQFKRWWSEWPSAN